MAPLGPCRCRVSAAGGCDNRCPTGAQWDDPPSRGSSTSCYFLRSLCYHVGTGSSFFHRDVLLVKSSQQPWGALKFVKGDRVR